MLCLYGYIDYRNDTYAIIREVFMNDKMCDFQFIKYHIIFCDILCICAVLIEML